MESWWESFPPKHNQSRGRLTVTWNSGNILECAVRMIEPCRSVVEVVGIRALPGRRRLHRFVDLGH